MIISVRASELARLEVCPGNYDLQRGLPDEQTELSKKGDLLHWYDAHPELDRKFLSSIDQDLLKRAKELDDLVMQRVTDQFSLQDKAFSEARETFGRYSEDGYEITGHPDRIRFYENNLTVIVEKKYGFIEQTPADINKQLRSYSVIFAKSESVVAMEQPRLSYEQRITLAHYTRDDLADSWKEIRGILEEASDPYARLNPTESGCRYCKAKLICKAYQSAMIVPTGELTPDKALSKAAKIAYLEQRLSELPNDKLSEILMAISFGKMLNDPANDEARRRGDTDFWSIAKETEVRDITDVRKALSLLSLAGLDKSDIFDCVQGVSLTKLTEKLLKIHPTWPHAQAQEWINKKLASVIEKQTRKARVLRK